MGIYISGVKGLPEQVQANKEDIKSIQEEIEGIDFEQIRQLESQVGENTQDINNMEASIGVQNQAINSLNDDVDALESKTQKITYDEQSGELTIDANVNVKRINITAAQTPLRADSMVSQDDKNAISLTGANDEISLIVGRSGTQHVLNFNADGTLDIDGNPVGGGATLYQHNIRIRATLSTKIYDIYTTIINNNPTGFTATSLLSYLNGKSHFIATGLLFISNDNTNNPIVYIQYSNGTNIRVGFNNTTGNVVSEENLNASLTTFNDTVIQIL